MNLDNEQLDALGEVVNIGVGRAAASLSELLGTRIELRVPKIAVKSEVECRDTGMSILQPFEGSISGTALLAFPTESGDRLAKLLGGYSPDDEIAAIELSGILSEVGNIVLNGVLGSLSNMIQADLKYSVPDFFVERPLDSLIHRIDENAEDARTVLVADTHFKVRSENIEGSVILVFELGSLKSLLTCLADPASTNS